MYRIIGVVLVAVSCGGFFWNKTETLTKKFNNLKELKKGITHLKHELLHSVCELPLAFSKASETVEGDVLVLFENMGKELAKNEIADMKLLWETSGGTDLVISESTRRIAEELIYNIGRKELDTEIEKIDNALNSLERTEAEEKEKTQKDKKLLYTLGASFFAAVVILFV